MKRHFVVALIALAALVLLPACTSTAPTLAGEGAAVLIKTTVPAAVPYVHTAASAIRSVNAYVAAPPSTATVHDALALWVNKLPVVSATEKAKMISYVTQKYDAALPAISKAENAAEKVEEFVVGLEKGGI